MPRILPCALLLLFPAVALAAGDAHGGPVTIPWSGLFWHSFNLALLLGVIFWFARRPIGDALKNRAAKVRRDIESAQGERAAARAELEDLEEKLADFELQVERLRKEMAEQAQHEREAILERAERESAAVQASAERAIRDEAQRARRQLQTEAVQLAVQLAEGILAARVGDDDQQALARKLLDAVEQDHSSIQGS
jgi:F-type H+-transporting ATPase subunit b